MNLDLFDEFDAEFSRLPAGPPEESRMTLRLPFSKMECLIAHLRVLHES